MSKSRLERVVGSSTTGGIDRAGGLEGRIVGAVLGHPRDLLAGGAGDLAAVVVGVRGALDHRMGRGQHPVPQRGEQLVFLVDEAFAGGAGELVLVGHRQRPRRAGLDAESAEDAAQIVDLVDPAVALPRRDLVAGGVGGGLDEDRVRRARPSAQLAADAALQAVGVPVELVASVIPGRRGDLLLGVLLGGDLPEHRGDRDAVAGHGGEELAYRALLRPVPQRGVRRRRPRGGLGAPVVRRERGLGIRGCRLVAVSHGLPPLR